MYYFLNKKAPMMFQQLNQFHHPSHLTLDNTKGAFDHIQQRGGQWSPYETNEGTVAAIGGDKCLVIAADTRVSRGFIFS